MSIPEATPSGLGPNLNKVFSTYDENTDKLKTLLENNPLIDDFECLFKQNGSPLTESLAKAIKMFEDYYKSE